jgi:hypothetical protein
MICIGADVAYRPALLAVGLLVTALTAVSPSVVHAACKEWQLHEFSIKQTNGFFVWGFPRSLGGGRFEGGIRYYSPEDDDPDKPDGLSAVEGKMEGSIRDDDVSFTVHWNNGSLGEYTGQISAAGFLDGKTVDKLNPGSSAGWSQIPWGGDKLEPAAECADAAAAPSPAPVSPPVSEIDKLGGINKGQNVGDILKDTKQSPAPAQPPAGGGGAEYATAITSTTIYVEPGGETLKDANGDDIGIAAGSKWVVLAKKTDPVWYKLQTNPVGWVWGEDVTLGP